MSIRHEYNLEKLAGEVEEEVQYIYRAIEKRALINHAKVLKAFNRARVSDFHLKGTTGYGYGDCGREVLENIYADIFRAEKALVWGRLCQALCHCPVSFRDPASRGRTPVRTGEPYDTLGEMIGLRGHAYGSLRELGIIYRQVEPVAQGIDYSAVRQALSEKTRMVMLQRSRGYGNGPSLGITAMRSVIKYIRQLKPDTVIFVDNCYGEFVEEEEPIEAGADLVAGSLIKNPGAACSNRRLCGRSFQIRRDGCQQVERTAWALKSGLQRNIKDSFPGLYLAPHTVAEALKGAVLRQGYSKN